jgi:hypothetical protein
MSEKSIKKILYVSVGLSWGITIAYFINLVLELLMGKDVI